MPAKVRDTADVLTRISNDPGRQIFGILRNAMMDRKTVSFIYDGKNKTVEVHALGLSTKDGSLVMRGYQVAGVASRPLPIWALYTVSKIEGLSVDFVTSEAPRTGFTPGDRQMDPVLCELAI